MTFKCIEHFRVIFHAAKDYVIVPAALSIFDRNDITLHRVTLLRINEPINDFRPLRCRVTPCDAADMLSAAERVLGFVTRENK